jgi:pimeloyl-ACP methyl ester carboxylesterase
MAEVVEVVESVLEVPGGRLAYDDTATTGPLVVCVPGMGDVRALYRFLRPRLVAAGHRVVTMDIRGHGDTSMCWPEYSPEAIGADIVALLRHLDAGPAVVIGESLAAASAVWAAAQAPALVDRIVLCGPFLRATEVGLSARLAIQVVGRFPTLWAMYYRHLYPSGPPADFASYRRSLIANLRQKGRMYALRALVAAPKGSCEARIPEVRCPALIVMGTADPDFPDPVAEARSVAGLLRAQLTLVDGAGHYPQAEKPEVTGPAIVDFLAAAHRA